MTTETRPCISFATMTVTRIHWGDHVAAALTPARRLFGGGWGDEAVLSALTALGRFARVPSAAQIDWRDERSSLGLVVRDGTFTSCVPELPHAARLAHVRWLGTQRVQDSTQRPVYVVLAASGDVGFRTRTMLWSPLVRSGALSVVLLENALYGERRPLHQIGTNVRTVAEHLAMNVAMVDEARDLLTWLRENGFTRRGIAGFSMGGSMAALAAAASHDDDIAVAIFAAGASAVPIFTEGLLSRSVDFETLAVSEGSVDRARERLGRIFAHADLERHPVPRRTDATVIVGGRRDGYVHPRTIDRLASHWRGAEVRWLDTGHAGALVLHPFALRLAAMEAMRRLGR